MVEKRFEKLGMPDIERFENYLPTAFNSELTLLQKVNKIIFDLIETNKLTNEMIDYLNKFIEKFDEKLYKTIEDVLQVWLEDGLLADIVREAINEEVIEARENESGKIFSNLKERLDEKDSDFFKHFNQLPYDVTFSGALNNGSINVSPIIQELIDQGFKNLYFPNGSYYFETPIESKGYLTIEGESLNTIFIIKNHNDLFKLNTHDEFKNFRINVEKAYYEGSLFEISNYTINADSPSSLFIKVHDIRISFVFESTYNEKFGNVFHIFSEINEQTSFKKGFWNVEINNISVNGGYQNFVKLYEDKSTSGWVTSIYFDKITLDAGCEYGFLGTKDKNNLLDPKYTDGEMIYFSNWRVQNNRTKNMFFFTKGSKYISRCIPWDWQYAPSGNYKPIGLQNIAGKFYNPVVIDGGYGSIDSIFQLIGDTQSNNLVVSLEKRVVGYLNFVKISGYSPIISYPIFDGAITAETIKYYYLTKIKKSKYQMVGNLNLISQLGRIFIKLNVVGTTTKEATFSTNTVLENMGKFYYNTVIENGEEYLRIYYAQDITIGVGAYLVGDNTILDYDNEFSTMYINPFLVEKPSNLVAFTNKQSGVKLQPLKTPTLDGNIGLNASTNNLAIVKDQRIADLVSISGSKPATSSAYGLTNTIYFDETHLYICLSSGKWRRVSLEVF